MVNLTHLLRSIFYGNESPSALAKALQEIGGTPGAKGEKGEQGIQGPAGSKGADGVSVTNVTGEASGNTITFHFALSNGETKDVEVTISGIGA